MNGRAKLVIAVALTTLCIAACGRPPVPGIPPAPGYALTGSLRGADGKPLGFASVALAGTPRGTVADDQGRFAIDDLRAGTYGLTVIHLGYRSAEAVVNVPAASEATVTLAMKRDARLGPALADSMGAVTVNYRLIQAGP